MGKYLKQTVKHLPAIVLILLFILVGELSHIVPLVTKPDNRVYTGMQGYSDDHVGYVSYIKEGIYGRNTFIIRTILQPQTQTTIHLSYIWMGKIGKLLGLDAPATYYFFQVILGVVFAVFTYRLFLVGLGKAYALVALFMALSVSSVGWFVRSPAGEFVYRTITSLGFTDRVSARLVNRPHYLIGAVLFEFIILILLRPGTGKSGLLAIIAGFILGLVHPTIAIILLLTVVVWWGVETYLHGAKTIRSRPVGYLSVIIALGCGLFLSYWSLQQYPLRPNVWLDYYANPVMGNISVWNDILAFGPLMWLGIPGLVIAVYKGKTKSKLALIMLIWIIIQMSLYFFLYRIFRSDRVRFIQSLYFVPLAYGCAYLLDYVRQARYQLAAAGLVILVFFTGPSFIESVRLGLYEYTDYSQYSVFAFPTRGQYEAYKWLDGNTPRESIVIAWWEAGNLILMYSHNRVLGIRQAWPPEPGKIMEAEREKFFRNQMTVPEAKDYLSKNNAAYVYYGYQEKFQGLQPDKYPYLRRVFKNGEAAIYEVFIAK